MQIGYIGLGSMGGALARRLQLQHPLVVHDRNPAAVRRMVEHGASACDGLKDLDAPVSGGARVNTVAPTMDRLAGTHVVPADYRGE